MAAAAGDADSTGDAQLGDPVQPCDDPMVTFRVRLCNIDQDPIPQAPCRITQGTTKITAEADENGIVTVQVRKHPNLLIVDWSDTKNPDGGNQDQAAFPFSLEVYILPGNDDTGLAQRLHNVGYSEEPNLEGKVRSFQRDFGRPETGALSAEEREELIRWHDGGDKPPVKRGQ